jgi:hypothetical protein
MLYNYFYVPYYISPLKDALSKLMILTGGEGQIYRFASQGWPLRPAGAQNLALSNFQQRFFMKS